MDLFNLAIGIVLVAIAIGLLVGIPAYFLRRGFLDGIWLWGSLYRYTVYVVIALAGVTALNAWRGQLHSPVIELLAVMGAWLIGLPYLCYAIGRIWGTRHRKSRS